MNVHTGNSSQLPYASVHKPNTIFQISMSQLQISMGIFSMVYDVYYLMR